MLASSLEKALVLECGRCGEVVYTGSQTYDVDALREAVDKHHETCVKSGSIVVQKNRNNDGQVR